MPSNRATSIHGPVAFGQTVISWTHTVSAGDRRVLWVAVAANDGIIEGTTVTVDGNSATLLAELPAFYDNGFAVFEYLSPAVGGVTVEATYPGTRSNTQGVGISYSDVDINNRLHNPESVVKSYGSSVSRSLTSPTADGSIISFAHDYNDGFTPAVSSDIDGHVNPNRMACGWSEAVAAATHTWEGSSDTNYSFYGFGIGHDAGGDPLTQSRYRWRNDDGLQADATWAAAEDTALTVPAGERKRVRIQIQADGDQGSTAAELRYRLQGSGDDYKSVP